MSERIEIFQIDQPRCENTYGVAPCTASGTPCFNTLARCQDFPNYVVSETPLTMYFHTECENPLFIAGMFPTMVSASRRAAELNIGSADPDKQPLGTRDVLRVTLKDHPYHDRYVDPYFRERTYNPMNQGTFWAKWLARNEDYEGWTAYYYVGKVGDTLGDMRKIAYEIQKIDGPDSNGAVSIECADILKRADNNRATIPAISQGTLSADIDNSVTTFTLDDNSFISEYPAEGKLTIGNEKMTYTHNGTTFTVVRGFDGSSAASHSEGEVIQLAYDIDEVRVDVILIDWLTNYVGIPATWITTADWTDEADTWLPTFIFTTTIWKPVGANQIIGELLRDSSAYLIPDLINEKLLFRAIRPTQLTKSVTDDDNILLGSFSIKRNPELKISQIWAFFSMRDTLGSMTDQSNFARLSVRFSDNSAVLEQQKIKRIFSRFLNSATVPITTLRIIERYQQEPREFMFSLEGDDAETLRLGDVCLLTHREIVDEYGAALPTAVQVISVHESERGGKVDYKAQAFAFEFTEVLWAPDDIPDWDAATDEQKATYLYWSDDDGLMSDGTTAPNWGS